MDTVLTRLGSEAIKEYPESISTSGFAFIPDRNMTFGGGSCGPNGVLVDCHDKFGQGYVDINGRQFCVDYTSGHHKVQEVEIAGEGGIFFYRFCFIRT